MEDTCMLNKSELLLLLLSPIHTVVWNISTFAILHKQQYSTNIIKTNIHPSPLTSNHWTQKQPGYMMFEIQVLSWDRHLYKLLSFLVPCQYYRYTVCNYLIPKFHSYIMIIHLVYKKDLYVFDIDYILNMIGCV